MYHVLTQILGDEYEEIQTAQAGEGGSSHSLYQVRICGLAQCTCAWVGCVCVCVPQLTRTDLLVRAHSVKQGCEGP